MLITIEFFSAGAEQGHWSDLAGSDFMMLLATCFCFLFIVKTTCQDWGQLYLLQERGLSAFTASSYLAAMEVGGLVGSILMGAITDFMIRRGYYFGTGKSPRMIVVQLLVAGSCMFLNLFLFTIDPETEKVRHYYHLLSSTRHRSTMALCHPQGLASANTILHV